MRFKLEHVPNLGWAITPLSGNLEGAILGYAEIVNLKDATLGEVIEGGVEGLWGFSITTHSLFDDTETLRSLRLGKSLDVRSEVKLVQVDGLWVEPNSSKRVRSADKLSLRGENVYIWRV